MRKGWISEPLYSEIKSLMPIPCVDLLIVHDRRLLLMKRKNEPAKGLWFTPGGRILLGESLEDAARRVLHEETGLETSSIEKMGVMTHIWSGAQTVTVYFKVTVGSYDIKMDAQHNDFLWISKVTDDLHPYVREMITQSNIFNKSQKSALTELQ